MSAHWSASWQMNNIGLVELDLLSCTSLLHSHSLLAIDYMISAIQLTSVTSSWVS